MTSVKTTSGAGSPPTQRSPQRFAVRQTLVQPYRWLQAIFGAASDRSASPGRVALGVSAVIVCAALGLLRQRGAGALDTIWAEDGTIFLGGAVDHGLLGSIFTSYAGYYHLLPRLLAQLTTLFPAGAAAYALALEAALCNALVALLVYVASADHLRSALSRVLVSMVVVVAPVAFEIPNSIANLHWAGLYAVFWTLLWTPRGSVGRIVAAVVVLLAADSDILIMVYVPLALLRATRRLPDGRRDRHGMVLASILGAGVAMQISGLLTGSSSRHVSPDPVPVVTGFVLRAVPHTILGEQWLGPSPHATRWLALAAVAWVVVAAALVVAVRRVTRPKWPLAAVAAAHSLGLYALPVLLVGLAITRYEAVPAMLFVTALVAIVEPGAGLASRVPLVTLAVLLVAVWAVNFRVDNDRAHGPRWSDELQQARTTCLGPATRAVISVPPRNDIPPWRVGVPCAYLRR